MATSCAGPQRHAKLQLALACLVGASVSAWLMCLVKARFFPPGCTDNAIIICTKPFLFLVAILVLCLGWANSINICLYRRDPFYMCLHWCNTFFTFKRYTTLEESDDTTLVVHNNTTLRSPFVSFSELNTMGHYD